MPQLPPVAPQVGWSNRIRLGRDYDVRLDASDYSVDLSVIGRIVDVHAGLEQVQVRHAGRLVAAHARAWARGPTITDPEHVATAKVLREQFRQPAHPAPHSEEELVRDLADYDRAFGLTNELSSELADGEEVV